MPPPRYTSVDIGLQAFRKAGGAGAGTAGKPAGKTAKFELTEEQKQEIREAFDLFDTDGSGVLLNCSQGDVSF